MTFLRSINFRHPTIATYAFAAVVLSIVGILIIPLPPAMLDALLAVNIVGAGTVLLVSITITDPLEFAAFAPALLVATLFRLSLDVSATRLILTQGHIPGAVGELIPAFGEFVIRGNLVVGLIIFAILIVIQFMVIASGSQRVAEVAARFTLDAMPGKQMAVDAEVHAGTLDPATARKKRAAVQKEADFYGAMDGAGKFVKGDAIAALIIVVLNLLGGLAVGILYHGISPLDALNTYALLTIGNALVTTLPAFLMSISMGMMVTRVAADGSLGFDLFSQVLNRPDVLRSAGVLSLLLAVVPAMPHIPFAVIGGLLIYMSRSSFKKVAQKAAAETAEAERNRQSESRRPEAALLLVGVDAIAIEFGTDLMGLLAPQNGEALLDRISDVRKIIAAETGIVIPGVRIRDDQTRDPLTYAIRVRDEIAATGRLRIDGLLAVGKPQTVELFEGEPARDPVYNLPGKWIPPEMRDKVVSLGAMVFDPISIIGSHLSEVARNRAADVFGRQELHTLVEYLKRSVPVVMKDIGTDVLPLPVLHKAISCLLRERVWPRDSIATIEAMLEAAATTRDPRELAEAARKTLVPQLLRKRNVRELQVCMFDPEFEARMVPMLSGHDGIPEPGLALYLRERIEAYVKTAPPGRGVILCTSGFRRILADLLERFRIFVDVFTFNEIPPDIEVRPMAMIGPPQQQAQVAQQQQAALAG